MNLEAAAAHLEQEAKTFMAAADACDRQRTAVNNYDDLKLSHVRKADIATLMAGAIRAAIK